MVNTSSAQRSADPKNSQNQQPSGLNADEVDPSCAATATDSSRSGAYSIDRTSSGAGTVISNGEDGAFSNPGNEDRGSPKSGDSQSRIDPSSRTGQSSSQTCTCKNHEHPEDVSSYFPPEGGQIVGEKTSLNQEDAVFYSGAQSFQSKTGSTVSILFVSGVLALI
ncbi:hypothetical protein HMI56_000491 [Coelomomyces lativittatus]|nr:hypothetical protein HMI56_000491 [Coelomomyces lativittatus]